MRTRTLLGLVPAAAMVAAALAAAPARALTPPALHFALGGSFGADGNPDSGGITASVAPLWPLGSRGRFGVEAFAHDIGSDIGALLDPHNGVDLGLVANRHRWAWGGAWRGDVDVVARPKWASSLTGTWGYWRIVDDVRGSLSRSASAVGVGAGIDARRRLTTGHMVGIAARWQKLFAERNSDYRRVGQYATVALEWNWAATTPQP